MNINRPDSNPDNGLLIEHAMWSTSKMCSWMRYSAPQYMNTDVQKSVCEAIAGRLSDLAANPRDVEQNTLRVFIRLSEMLDDYCMGGARPPNYTLPDIRREMNEAANSARALLSLFAIPKCVQCGAGSIVDGKCELCGHPHGQPADYSNRAAP